jgi:hypothetical protein
VVEALTAKLDRKEDDMMVRGPDPGRARAGGLQMESHSGEIDDEDCVITLRSARAARRRGAGHTTKVVSGCQATDLLVDGRGGHERCP